MHKRMALLASTFIAVSYAQQIGTPEVHPPLSWQKCSKAGTCTTVLGGGVVLDASMRSIRSVNGGALSCFTDGAWNESLCPDDVTCAGNCALEGANYRTDYGITTSGNTLKLDFVTNSTSYNVGSRVYLTASSTGYQLFKPLNQEFSFDVDVSNLPCGLNGALYFAQMDADGGKARYPTNKAGAMYGTGYCDSQCPKSVKFINGQANAQGWYDAGVGMYGSCCNELDVWEANSMSSTFTSHPCTVTSQTRCVGTQCGLFDTSGQYPGVCDLDGCDYNAYRQGNKAFYGPGQTVDTTQKFTVVTQFITNNNTPTGNLTEIRRLYVQNGKVIHNPRSSIPGTTQYNSISDAFCTAQKTAFNDTDTFENNGGMASIGKGLTAGMVLVLSISDDRVRDMLWLDSDYPTDVPSTSPGVQRGPCSTTSGVPPTVESEYQTASVTFSNIKFGDIGSTYATTSSHHA